MQINKHLTPYNFTDCNDTGRIKYIVIHYVGALGGAEANCRYYASQYVGASAHLYVGFNGEIWRSVEDKDIAWHCGASSYVHPECRNSNSIGIELCVRKRNTGSLGAADKDWYFEDATVKAGIQLARELMEKYNIPESRVIRHYDVTGKICPNPYVYNTTVHTWTAFKAALTKETDKKKNADGTYTIKKGDTLYAIAQKFGCSVNYLKRWNGLKTTEIAVGQKLKFYYWHGRIISGGAPIREGAGKKKKMVAALPKGTVLEVTGSRKSAAGNKWFKVRYKDKIRYVCAKWIEKV